MLHRRTTYRPHVISKRQRGAAAALQHGRETANIVRSVDNVDLDSSDLTSKVCVERRVHAVP